jgi:hypothetical protein
METNIDRSWSYAIVLAKTDLEAIATVLTEHYGDHLKITAKCIEGSKLVTGSFDELVEYENASFRRIESIDFDFGKRREAGGSVYLGPKLFQVSGISITDTDDARALKVASEIEKRIDSCKPWYSVFTRLPLVGWSAILAVAFGSLVTWARILRTGDVRSSDISFLDVFYVVVPFLVVFWIAVHYLDKGWQWLFPRVCFLIGRQVEVFDKQAKARTFVLAGVLLTVVLGVVANLITMAITKGPN